MLSKSCFCNLASTVSSLLQVAKAQAVFAYGHVVSVRINDGTRTSSWGLNSSARRAASRATASNKRGARCEAVAKAQAVLAVWKSNFGCPTPSTRRRPRNCICSTAWRFHAINATLWP